MNSEEGGVSLLRRRPRREASGVLPRIPCIGLTFFPPPLSLSVLRPPSSSPSFHAIGQKTSSSAAPASLESEAARRRFGGGKADAESEGERGGREGGRKEGTSEKMEEEGATTTKVKSKFLPRQGAQRGRPCPSNSDGCGGGGGGVRNAKPKHYPIYRTATAAEEEEEREGTRPIIENTREGRDGKDDFSPLQGSCLPPVCLSYP